MKDAAFMSIVPKQEDAKAKIVYMGERLKKNKMKMSIAEAIETLLYARSYGTAHLAKSVAIKTMRKYQKIQEIYQKWNEVNDFTYNQAMQEIGEVIESE